MATPASRTTVMRARATAGTLTCEAGRCSCGGRDQVCCNGTECDPGTTCRLPERVCRCGQRDEPCCSGSCVGALDCVGDICRCGQVDQPCCDGRTCETGV